MYDAGKVTSYEKYLQGVKDRELEFETGMGNGIAIPHCKSDCVKEAAFTLVKLNQKIEWGSLDGEPVDYVIMLAAPNSADNVGLFVYSGGTVYLYRRYEAHRILECIEKNKITFMHGSPTVFGLLMDLKEEYPALPSLRMMLCGSSYMPVEKLKQLHKWLPTTEIRTVFGMTETASPGTLFPTDTALSIYPSSSGRPVPGLELKILDDDGHEVETGTVGTVYIRGANVVEYYYKMESPLFTEDGWLDTGDMGYQNEDAFVFFVDRKKDMVNRGGEKIWCTDVEDELIAFKGVKDAAVVGIPNEKYGEVAAAVVVLEKGAQLTEEQIKEEMLKEMARFKVPERILFLDAIPKTPGLKTDKKYIRTLFQ